MERILKSSAKSHTEILKNSYTGGRYQKFIQIATKLHGTQSKDQSKDQFQRINFKGSISKYQFKGFKRIKIEESKNQRIKEAKNQRSKEAKNQERNLNVIKSSCDQS